MLIKHVIFILSFIITSLSAFSQSQVELLYPDNTSLNQIDQNEIRVLDKEGKMTHISNVSAPRILIYKPESVNGIGIIICPGGGYRRLNLQNTEYIAKRLNKFGITVFVLAHRLPVDKNITTDKETIALQDVQAALRMVRNRAKTWSLNPTQIGLWGSSAGGHLASMATTHFRQAFLPGADTAGLRPDFLILAWPVISFRKELVNKGSMVNLLGDNPSKDQIAFNSPDEWVDKNTPPTFLVHASDDTTVKVENSIQFYHALLKAGVQAEMHLYQNGGHGFGIAPESGRTWMNVLEEWLKYR